MLLNQNQSPRSESQQNEIDEQKKSNKVGHISAITSCLISFVPFVKSAMCCKMGYVMNVEPYLTDTQSDEQIKVFDDEKSAGWSLGVNIKRLSSVTVELGMVRPYVKIHVVDIRSGRYLINSKRLFRPVAPVRTKSCFLKEISVLPIWGEELVIEAPFSMVSSNDTLILFEILDTRTTLSISSKKLEGLYYFSVFAFVF